MAEKNALNIESLKNSTKVISPEIIGPFILVTCLFALWGFANDITNPLVKAFKEIFLISNAQSSLVQTAFYGGYATMALPAALFIRKYTYKSGILLGLGLYATGALLFIPASLMMKFELFLAALYILTFGLAFLETTANPYILSMGSEKTATRRLNLAQAFNPMGSLIGMVVASNFILKKLWISQFRGEQMAQHPEYATMLPGQVDAKINAALEAFRTANPDQHRMNQLADLMVVRTPYVVIGLVVLTFLVIFAVSKLPKTGSDKHVHFFETLGRLFRNWRYLGGVVAQTFYVGAQIMCWTYIIHYAMTNLKMDAATAQNYNIMAMVIFCSSRFICTYMLKYISPSHLLLVLALGGIGLTGGAIFIKGMTGLYSLIGISACMSLMFPTIYGIALDGMGEDAKLASAGLIFAIVGGALMPPMQGWIIDMKDFTFGSMTLESVRVSFVLPLICFIVIALYGWVVAAFQPKTIKAS